MTSFEIAVRAVLSDIKFGIDHLDNLALCEDSPTNAQFKQIAKLHKRLGEHVWKGKLP